jgi:hypothetical protein
VGFAGDNVSWSPILPASRECPTIGSPSPASPMGGAIGMRLEEQRRPVARILLHPVGRLWGHRFSGAQKPSGALAFSTFTAYFYQ